MPIVHLQSFDELLAELDRREKGAPPSLGPMLAHCAQSIEYGCVGFPQMRGALFRATVGRIAKWKFLRDGSMKHDLNAPVLGAPSVEGSAVEAGFARIREAVRTFRAKEGPLPPHFAYGPLTRAEAERLQSMHVADHLSSVSGER